MSKFVSGPHVVNGTLLNCSEIMGIRNILWNLILVWIVCVHLVTANLSTAKYSFEQEQLMESLENYQITTPMLVDHQGDLISYDLINSRKRTPRSIGANVHKDVDRQLFYKVPVYNTDFHLDLKINSALVSGKFRVEYWDHKGLSWKHNTHDACHYIGHIKNHPKSSASVSNCRGLHGVFSTATEEYIIEPLHNVTETHSVSEGHPHLVYKRSALASQRPKSEDTEYSCGVDDEEYASQKSWVEDVDHFMEEAKQQAHAHRRRRRATSRKDYFVETLVVVDKMMYGYHGRDNIEPYTLTVMNIVSNLYHDVSIGNSINIVVARMVIIMKDQQHLEITHHADRSLDSFCLWQNSINPAPDSKAVSDEGIAHHDNAVLITRIDICRHQNKPCGTLGLATMGGMCEPERSCSINEDMGLASAFTIAHEMGHNFGMVHDGSGNDCGKPGHGKAKIMAAQMNRNTDPFSWSHCSRSYISEFLDAGKGHCLENPSSNEVELVLPTEMPGQVHNADEQCKFQHGPRSRQCKHAEVCGQLWCISQNNRCATNSIPAAQGTKCVKGSGEDGWCYQGECVPYGDRPNAVDGGWGEWTSWGPCSRTCGGGVSASERHCDNPVPAFGGKYCPGERKKYQSCNIDDCPENSRDFRELQCAKFDNDPFRGLYYNWVPFLGLQVVPCALNCQAGGYNFYVKKAAQVVDGTKCNKESLDICINGQCREVGCDKILGSTKVEDRCRVCDGDGSTCETVSGLFEDDVAKGDYHEVITIPRGSVHIEVAEVAVSGNYLALRSVNDEYYINGEWAIDWPRSFDIAGSTFKYERPSDRPESLTAPGPTTEDLIVMLLLQEDNPGVKYRYNVPVTRTGSGDNEITFSWEHKPWSECSATCAGGVSTAPVICVRSDDNTETLSPTYCNAQARPADRTKSCNTEPCPPEWFLGEWSPCSTTCGGGYRTRTVACISKIAAGEQEMVPEDQCMTHKPASRETCGVEPCPPIWVAEPWGECTPNCGPGQKTRIVSCMSSDMKSRLHPRSCAGTRQPPSQISCNNGACPPPSWTFGEWGECSADCGKGQQTRTVSCQAYTGLPSQECDDSLRPPSIQECDSPCVTEDKTEVCEDVSQVSYCPLVLKFKFCNRAYFYQMCCKSCSQVEKAGR